MKSAFDCGRFELFRSTLKLLEIFFQNINKCLFSLKQIKAAVKEDESILLGKKSKGIDVSRSIYELVQSAIKGIVKKDGLLSVLTDLTVSSEIFNFIR